MLVVVTACIIVWGKDLVTYGSKKKLVGFTQAGLYPSWALVSSFRDVCVAGSQWPMWKVVTHQSVLFVVTEVIGNGQRGDRERKHW